MKGLHCMLLVLGLAVASPKRYLLLGTWYGGATPAFVDAGAKAGFNSVRVTADWGKMERSSGVVDWEVLDNQTAYVVNEAKLPLLFNVWLRRDTVDDVIPLDGMAVDQNGQPSPNPNGLSISFANNASMLKAAQFVRAVVERYTSKYSTSVLAFSVVYSGYSESEFFPGDPSGGYYDYSNSACTAFRVYLRAKYTTVATLNRVWGTTYSSFDAVEPPLTDSTGRQMYLDWYLYREASLRGAIKSMTALVHSSSARAAVQWGSVYDGALRRRGLIAFPCLAEGVQVVWVDDAPSYPHAFAMDFLRSNLPSGTWLANEIDNPHIADDDTYYKQAAQSYEHGCAVISVANWDTASLVARTSLFQRIAKDFLGSPVPSHVPSATMNVSALDLFNSGSAAYVAHYHQVSDGGKHWVDVHLNIDIETC